MSPCLAPPTQGHIHLDNLAPISGTRDGYEIGAVLSGGDHRAQPDLTLALGDEGLYVRIFRYRVFFLY